ncbi:MAG: PA0069 family radical SAM protein [Planctomycetota bacterium]
MRPVANPPNPWLSRHVELLGAAPPADLEVYEEEAKSIVSSNDSPDLAFRFSINPYRGCFHGCAYCYARPTHQYLGFGAGTDFERRIVVKTNAAALLDRELRRPKLRGEVLAFSGVTDCYQPIEASYGLTRACLEVCVRHRQAVGIVTKGALVERDVDVLRQLTHAASACVFVSVPFADAEMARAIEPFAPGPERRLRTMATLADAGIEVGVAVAPLIPGLNDDQVPAILAAAKAAGASRAFTVALRLPAEVKDVFLPRLRQAFPLRAGRVESGVRALRDGAWNDARFGSRMQGSGERARVMAQLFTLQCRRLGLALRGEATQTRPRPQQGLLFGDAARGAGSDP